MHAHAGHTWRTGGTCGTTCCRSWMRWGVRHALGWLGVAGSGWAWLGVAGSGWGWLGVAGSERAPGVAAGHVACMPLNLGGPCTRACCGGRRRACIGAALLLWAFPPALRPARVACAGCHVAASPTRCYSLHLRICTAHRTAPWLRGAWRCVPGCALRVMHLQKTRPLCSLHTGGATCCCQARGAKGEGVLGGALHGR